MPKKTFDPKKVYLTVGNMVPSGAVSMRDRIIIGYKGVGEDFVPHDAVLSICGPIHSLKEDALKKLLLESIKQSQYVKFEMV